jgi:hypothetical protein
VKQPGSRFHRSFHVRTSHAKPRTDSTYPVRSGSPDLSAPPCGHAAQGSRGPGRHLPAQCFQGLAIFQDAGVAVLVIDTVFATPSDRHSFRGHFRQAVAAALPLLLKQLKVARFTATGNRSPSRLRRKDGALASSSMPCVNRRSTSA